jgi:hypothetical protein
MRAVIRAAAVACGALALVFVTGCAFWGPGGSLVKHYEYEEEVYLSLDGTATIYVNASLPALVSLRGLDLDLRPNVRLDKNAVRRAYTSPVTEVVRVSSWRRFGRRFVQVRLKVTDIRRLAMAAPFAWSTYSLVNRDGLVVYRQQVGAAAGRDVGQVGWKGTELIAVRVHLPARIRYHNAGADNLKRGNILVWEQSLAARQAGSLLDVEARMDQQTILYSTLKLFAVSGAIAIGILALLIWWVVRKGRARRWSASR